MYGRVPFDPYAPAPMDASVAAVCLAVVATMAGATIQGGIGFGMNLVTVPILALFIPEALPATAVFLGIPISIAMVRHEFHALDRRGIGWIMVGRVPGSILGAWVVATVTLAALQAFIGVVVLLIVGVSLLAPPIPAASGNPGDCRRSVRCHRYHGRHRRPADRVALSASPGARDPLHTRGVLLLRDAALDRRAVGRGQGRVGSSDPRGDPRRRSSWVGSVLGRRMHGALDRGWLRPAVLVFAASSAVVVILDAAL